MRLILPFALAASVATADLVRIAEAVRLAESIRDTVWPGWASTPFPVLLVDAEREYLVGFPRAPEGFTAAGYSSVLRAPILTRPRQFQPDLLATFPAFGPPSLVVVGRPEATRKDSASWVLTLLHEHFHQLQNGEPSYFREVEALGLSGGDQTGMWMLNFPFPYEDAKVAERFAVVARQLGRALEQPSAEARRAVWKGYSDFLGSLSDRDRRYLGFQVWQEGFARYVELRVAEAAARGYEASMEMRALPDVRSFATIAEEMRATILKELASPDLPKRKRVSFYAFGAGLALLLDEDAPGWKSRYLTEKFTVEKYRE